MELAAPIQGLKNMGRQFWFGTLVGTGIGVLLTLGSGVAMWKRVGLFSNSPEERAAWVIRKLGRELSLEQKQLGHLNQIKDEILARRSKSDLEREQANRRILTQLEAERMDPAELNRIFDERMDSSREMRELLLLRVSEFHATLTPEQRQTLCRKAEHFLKTHGTPL